MFKSYGSWDDVCMVSRIVLAMKLNAVIPTAKKLH